MPPLLSPAPMDGTPCPAALAGPPPAKAHVDIGRWACLVVAVAGIVALPWTMGGSFGHAALAEALGGRVWLWPLIAAPLLALPDRTGMLFLAGTFVLAALGADAVMLAGGREALGWGPLCLALGGIGWIARALARRGYGNGQGFVTGSLSLILGLLLVFVLYPLLCVLSSALRNEAGGIDIVLFVGKFGSPSIWSLACLQGGACGTAWNSLFIAAVVGGTTTLLGAAFALLAVRTTIPLKPLLRGLSILPIVTPPFVIGLALILVFGRAGMVTTWLATHAGIPRSRWIYGFWGITIAQVLAFTPIAFMILSGVLGGISPTLEEAARMLRARSWYGFRTVTWPLLRPGLTNAFLIGFVESLADFANPLVIGGNYNVLSTDIFFAVVGASHDQGRAAVLALILLGFTLATFALQTWWLGRTRFTTVTGKGDGGQHSALPRGLMAMCLIAVVPWLVLTIAVYGSIMVGGFVEQIGRDDTPTLRYFWTAFSIDHGVGGWFLSGSAWPSFLTTLELGLIAMPITAGLGILTAYLLDRVPFKGRRAFEFLTMMSFAIPGTVIGIGYILAFNSGAIRLTGTGAIIVAAFVFRNMPVGIRASLATLTQIDRSLDEASLLLRSGRAATLWRVIVPLSRPAIATAMIYSLVRAMTAVSAVIFLVTGGWNLATVYIVGRADVGEYGIAIVYSAVLILFMMVLLLAIQALFGQARLGRRADDAAALAS